jgi:hypothetical protein
MKYLLDTDWSIDYLHRVDRVVQRLGELTEESFKISCEMYQ